MDETCTMCGDPIATDVGRVADARGRTWCAPCAGKVLAAWEALGQEAMDFDDKPAAAKPWG